MKFDPIEEDVDELKFRVEKLIAKLNIQETQIQKVDAHYNGVAKAILNRHGVVLAEINEYNILKSFARLA